MTFNALVPELDVSNFEASLRFYVEILGFRVEYSRVSPPFALLSLGGAQLMIQQEQTGWAPTGDLRYPYGRGINFQIRVSNATEFTGRLLDAGIGLHRPLEKTRRASGGQDVHELELHVLDPDGYHLRFSELIQAVDRYY
jgi:catechol 2,3-dioxygenase-like lactoylglutathione lyase family enzyme